MTALYLTQPDAILGKKQEAFFIKMKQENGTWQKKNIPAQTVTEIVLMSYPQITGEALAYALELNIPIHYLSPFGKYVGSALPAYSRNGQLRLAQYAAHCQEEKRVTFVKAIVKAKIHNQYHVLSRHGITNNPLKQRQTLVNEKMTVDEIRGVEGLSAREYWSYWSQLLGEEWQFSGRNYHPPTDPINSLLSFAYGLLRSQITSAVHIAGLDPYIGYLHDTTRGQPAMVLDLIEEFRPLIADNLVLGVISHKQIQPSDFNESLGAYRLSDSARKSFLQSFEQKLQSEFKHPVFGYQCSYRSAIQLQARLFSRALQEDLVYHPLVLR